MPLTFTMDEKDVFTILDALHLVKIKLASRGERIAFDAVQGIMNRLVEVLPESALQEPKKEEEP